MSVPDPALDCDHVHIFGLFESNPVLVLDLGLVIVLDCVLRLCSGFLRIHPAAAAPFAFALVVVSVNRIGHWRKLALLYLYALDPGIVIAIRMESEIGIVIVNLLEQKLAPGYLYAFGPGIAIAIQIENESVNEIDETLMTACKYLAHLACRRRRLLLSLARSGPDSCMLRNIGKT